MNTALLSEVTPGFARPVHGAQSVFRQVLEAMSRPGRVLSLDTDDALDGLRAPAAPGAAMGRGMAALLLTLLDAETTLQLGGTLSTPQATAFCRFHTGVSLVGQAARAAFSAWRHDEAMPALWRQLDNGSDESPEGGATLLIEVASLVAVDPLAAGVDAPERALRLRGPGIEAMHRLVVGGPTRDFWLERIAMQLLYPRGVDLVLCCGERVAAIPRSTVIEQEAACTSR